MEAQMLRFSISNTHFSRQTSNFCIYIIHFPFYPINAYNKRSDFASALLTSEAKAHIFHQHHLFHKQTLIFSILITKITKKLLKIGIS